MTRRVSMVLAVAAASAVACGLYFFSRLRGETEDRQTEASTAPMLHIARGGGAEAGAPLALAADGDEDSPLRPFSGTLHEASSPLELTADPGSRIRQRYGELFREMDLSEQEIEALVAALLAGDRGHSEPRSRDELDAAHDAERERAAVSAVLGPAKGLQFERLKKTLPARMQLDLAREQLQETDTPLREDQRKQLLAIVTAQEPLPPWRRIEGESIEQQFARYREWQKERAKRFLEHAAPVLTPAQKKHLEEQAAMHASAMPLRPSEIGAAGARAPR